jgi:hypothetical protein
VSAATGGTTMNEDRLIAIAAALAALLAIALAA